MAAFQRKWNILLREFLNVVEQKHSEINNNNYKEICERRQRFILTQHADLVDFIGSTNSYLVDTLVDSYILKKRPQVYDGLEKDQPTGWRLKEQLKDIVATAAVGRKDEEEIRSEVKRLIFERFRKKEEDVSAG